MSELALVVRNKPQITKLNIDNARITKRQIMRLLQANYVAPVYRPISEKVNEEKDTTKDAMEIFDLGNLWDFVRQICTEVNPVSHLQVDERPALYVPLLFWFNRDPGLAIPYPYIPYPNRRMASHLSDNDEKNNA